jgi:hypothetical protein
MRIQLERKLALCPDRLRCTVCHQAFQPQRIRSLLYSDRGLLQGDVCHSCLRLDAAEFKQTISLNAQLAVVQSGPRDRLAQHYQQQAQELLSVVSEKVRFPSPLQWLVQWVALLCQESQELEATRLGLAACSNSVSNNVGMGARYCADRLRLQRIYELE